MSSNQDERKYDSNEENCLYSFPSLKSIDDDTIDNNEKLPPLLLELIPLPFVSTNYEQMPVGARGWYASAVLSAMMMLSYRSIDGAVSGARLSTENDNCAGTKNPNKGLSNSELTNGTDFLREDLKRACANTCGTNSTNVFLELGSGTIGLAGMTMAWIVAQHGCFMKTEQDSIISRNRVMLTDYDHDCLKQLERNVVGVRRSFCEYFSLIRSKYDHSSVTDYTGNDIVPDIDVMHLDWNEYDQDQSPTLPDNKKVDDGAHHFSISFACGAALVYIEDTIVCVDQVAKILRLHKKSVVWVVQWPRDGWFSVFHQDLLSTRHESDDLKIHVQKFGPSSSPDMFSTEVQLLAQELMPEAMQQETSMRIKDLRAIRISNIVGENLDDFS